MTMFPQNETAVYTIVNGRYQTNASSQFSDKKLAQIIKNARRH